MANEPHCRETREMTCRPNRGKIVTGGDMPKSSKGKMRAVQVLRPNAPFEIVEREIPDPGPGSVRIKVQACGICHSDTLTKEGAFPLVRYPRVPGHEVVGV